MGGLFSGGDPMPAPAPPPPAPAVTDPATQQAAQDLAFAQAQAAGRNSTIMTSGQGDQSAVSATKKTLLGA